jgi:hypothetical protein
LSASLLLHKRDGRSEIAHISRGGAPFLFVFGASIMKTKVVFFVFFVFFFCSKMGINII